MGNRWYTQFFGTLHKKPVMMDCNFIVDSTNGNGFGARSLKGAGIYRVYMNTSASFVGSTHSNTVVDAIASTSSLLPGMPISGSGIPAGTTINSITSSTAIVISQAATTSVAGGTIHYSAVGAPLASSSGGILPGYILVQFQDNFNYYIGGTAGFVSPISGTPISISGSSVLTIGDPYTIVSVGTSTQANWQAVGLPAGQIPTVGQTFIATVTGGGTGTGVVEAPSVSGIDHIEVIGDPNQTFGANFNGASFLGGGFSGSYMIMQCLNAGAVTAPANGTVIGLTFFLSNSYIAVQGY